MVQNKIRRTFRAAPVRLLYKGKVKISLLQVMEAPRDARG
jgi:hypothetical protein